ncbi:MAG: class I SAM-dependent methyltransferase [Patescibacteria group bacterium]
MSNEHIITKNRKQHDRNAYIYNTKHTEIYNPVEQRRLGETIAEVISLTKINSPVVLDYGAGTGNLSRIFAEKGAKVIACDLSSVSLEILQNQYSALNIETALFDGKKLPFEDDHFDIVAVYSVLHHIPDYISAIKEMIRVAKPGGLIYIDHEANEHRWYPDVVLAEYNAKTKQTKAERTKFILRTGEFLTWDFVKTVFIKLFINKKYQREGDIHVFPEDYIEWDKIFEAVSPAVEIIKNVDYLMYQPKATIDEYNNYAKQCTDTKCVIFRKK